MSVRIRTAVLPLSQVALPLLMILFGLTTMLVLGFANGEMLHEFVHDGRHLLGIPCH